MTEAEIIIAHLKAAAALELIRAKAHRSYPFNTGFGLKANICEETHKQIMKSVDEWEKKLNKP